MLHVQIQNSIQSLAKYVCVDQFIEYHINFKILQTMQSNNFHDIDFFKAQQKILGKTIELFDENLSINQPDIVLSGFPYDQLHRKKKLRVGCHKGTIIFRQKLILYPLIPKCNPIIWDAGDISKQLQYDNMAFSQLKKKHYQLLRLNSQRMILAIGGTKDQTISNFEALRELFQNKSIGIINLHQQADTHSKDQQYYERILKSSAYQQNKCKTVYFGVRQNQNYLNNNYMKIVSTEQINQCQLTNNSVYRTKAGIMFENEIKQISGSQAIIISIDLNVLSSKWMPGVTKPNVTGGLQPDDIFEIMTIIGSEKRIKIVQISGFNPGIESLISGSLIIQMFYYLVEGFANRQKSNK